MRIAGVAGCALAAWGAWYGEITLRFGWPGTKWLDGPDAPFLVCPLVALGIVFALGLPAGFTATVGFILLAGTVFLGCYGGAGEAIEELHTTWVPSLWQLVHHGGAVVLGWLFASVAVLLCVRIFLVWIRLAVFCATAAALALVVPLSLVSVAIYSRGGHDYLTAVKMGYPVLWTALLVPTAVGLAWRWTPKEMREREGAQEE